MRKRSYLKKSIISLDQIIQACYLKTQSMDKFIIDLRKTNLNKAINDSEIVMISNLEKAQMNFARKVFLLRNQIQNQTKIAGLEVESWDKAKWANLQLNRTKKASGVVRIGDIDLENQNIHLPRIPALIPFIRNQNILFLTARENLKAANNAICSIVWRIIASNVPDTYKLLFIDTINHGSSFSSFIKLPEIIRGEKIFCQEKEILELLSESTRNMEDIIQKRLRDKYENVESFNFANPKNQIPYHIIVISAFPEFFTHQSAQCLNSIVQSGIKAGYYLICSLIDEENQLYQQFGNKIIEKSVKIRIKNNGNGIIEDSILKNLLVDLDSNPSNEISDLICLLVKEELSKYSDIIHLSAFLPGKNEEWWSKSSESGLSVDIGTDPNGKNFNIEFGRKKDTFHALIGGRIGSGKSNFLHALILSLCAFYSIDELEVYLIDFKEGVEFQDYASYQLPHARAIVIEAEREFGLSVLEYLSGEMERRAEIFKNSESRSSVNIEEYRSKSGKRMPRIVVVIDEFIKLFEEDDAIALRSYQYLKELAQRSRAFGIHLVLAAQRPMSEHQMIPIKSQIGLRVAFKCNEPMDSVSILGERNEMAAFLERSGIACITYDPTIILKTSKIKIGLVSENEKIKGLEKIRQLSESNNQTHKKNTYIYKKWEPVYWNCQEIPKIIKSYNENHKCESLIFLGQPIRLIDFPVIEITRQENENILAIGSDENLATKFIINSLLSIIVTSKKNSEILWLSKNGSVGVVKPFREIIIQQGKYIDIIENNSGLKILEELRVRIENRKNELNNSNDIYLFINGLHRNFGNSDREILEVRENLDSIIKFGPICGIHSILWVDNFESIRTFTSSNRVESFRHRIVFHLNSSDSFNIIGSNEAAIMDQNRLIYRNQNWIDKKVEKIKPFEVPTICDINEIIYKSNEKV